MVPYGLKQNVNFKKNFGPELGDINLNTLLSVNKEQFIKKLNPIYNCLKKIKSNLFNGCNVISEDRFSFKHKFIKLGFNFLISLNSGKYLPACLINQIGLLVVFLFIIQS